MTIPVLGTPTGPPGHSGEPWPEGSLARFLRRLNPIPRSEKRLPDVELRPRCRRWGFQALHVAIQQVLGFDHASHPPEP